jgi:hypothetical protein
VAIRKGVLSMRWSKRENDLLYEWGDGCKKADSSLLHHVIGCERQRFDFDAKKRGDAIPITWDPSFVKELELRGYDLTTLKFSVRKRELPLTVDAVDPHVGDISE